MLAWETAWKADIRRNMLCVFLTLTSIQARMTQAQTFNLHKCSRATELEGSVSLLAFFL